MPQREGPSPEIYIQPAGEKLWTISWHFLESPYKRSEAQDTREALRVDTAYELVWELLYRGYSLHNTNHYDELQDALTTWLRRENDELEAMHKARQIQDRAYTRAHQGTNEEEEN